MHKDDEIPRIQSDSSVRDALIEMTSKGFGMTTVLDKNQQLLGVFTDGDLRRVVDQRININTAVIRDVITPGCKTVSKDMLAAEALKIMEDNKITALVIHNDKNEPCGVLHLHDILRAGVM